MTEVKLIWLFLMCHDSHCVIDHYVCPHIAGRLQTAMLIYCAELVEESSTRRQSALK